MNTELAKRFNERAKGEYKIEVYAGGALAKLPEYFVDFKTFSASPVFAHDGLQPIYPFH